MAKKKSDKSADAPQTVEALIARLEEIATQIQEGQLGLEESIELYEEGRRIATMCQERLAAAQRKLEILSPARPSDSEPQPDAPSAPDSPSPQSSNGLFA